MSVVSALLAAPLAIAPIARAAEEEFDPNTVTPGVWGFIITFGVMVAVTLLVIDMTRRIRRTNYRAEVREELAREMAEAAQAEAGRSGPDGPAPTSDAAGTAADGGRAQPGASDDGATPTR
ncbi:hypothetical protein [Agromyces salentinus]|uniref:hypothetical protein n=1 Tax=Agromyces salentinus TaxID=269421 RepID=UPI0031B5D432